MIGTLWFGVTVTIRVLGANLARLIISELEEPSSHPEHNLLAKFTTLLV